ncbi:hypothetical protein [Streptomyces sp. NPDC047928]|uniref:hypothetical protein n=1 Tax=unclassified Streptomyces TaxID=2593676 RepID=UPI0037137A75
MSGDHHDEPVFVRSNWGTNRYVYNTRNPVGLALTVGALLFAGGGMYTLHDSSRWSEGELRDAVHAAARSLEAEPRVTYLHYGYDDMIEEAIEAAGEGPSNGWGLSVSRDRWAEEAGPDRFDITTSDTKAAYCMTVAPPEPDHLATYPSTAPGAPRTPVDLTVEVAEGSC